MPYRDKLDYLEQHSEDNIDHDFFNDFSALDGDILESLL
jgi:hypothetical protein